MLCGLLLGAVLALILILPPMLIIRRKAQVIDALRRECEQLQTQIEEPQRRPWGC